MVRGSKASIPAVLGLGWKASCSLVEVKDRDPSQVTQRQDTVSLGVKELSVHLQHVWNESQPSQTNMSSFNVPQGYHRQVLNSPGSGGSGYVNIVVLEKWASENALKVGNQWKYKVCAARSIRDGSC